MLTIRLNSTQIVTDLLPFSRTVYCSSRSVRHHESTYSETVRQAPKSNRVLDNPQIWCLKIWGLKKIRIQQYLINICYKIAFTLRSNF